MESGHINEELINLISENKNKLEEFIKIINNKIILEVLTKHSGIQLHAIIKHLDYEEIELIVNYLTQYNYIYDNKKKENDKRSFICLDELNEIDNISILMFFLMCCTAKKDYQINITKNTIKEITNIYLKKEVKTKDENILKLAKAING